MFSVHGFTAVVFLSLGVAVFGGDVFVDIAEGTLRGKSVEFVEKDVANVSATINVFKGIPYAERPLRFTPPVQKTPWSGVLNATEYTASCPQILTPELTGGVTYVTDEDCLALNVFAPNQTESQLPVMVFIHGGGYTTGSSMTPSFEGIPLAAVGHVVLVTINYRLGAHGFLSTGDKVSPGNYGLLDQAMALKWVRRNIEAFGGNSSMVTIFGESAGASSVDMHVVSAYSHDLFDQAITQSGQAVAYWNIREEFESTKRDNAFRLGALLNCTTTDSTELIQCLSQVDIMVMEETSIMNGIRMGPTIDGNFIDDYPLKLTESGNFKHCPMMIGFNRDEGNVNILFDLPGHLYDKEPPFVNKEDFDMLVTRSLLTISGFTSDLMEESVKHEYVDWSQVDNPSYNYLPAATNVYGDDEFSCPSILTARAHATMTSQPVYLYYFTHVPEWSIFEVNGTGPGWMGATHAEELPFVFGYSLISELDGFYGPMTAEEEHFSVKLMRHWSNFARTGDPSVVGGWAWPPFRVPELRYIDLNLDASTKRGLKADECAFWNDLKLQLQDYLVSMDDKELDWREEFDDWKDDLANWRMAFGEYQEDANCDGN